MSRDPVSKVTPPKTVEPAKVEQIHIPRKDGTLELREVKFLQAKNCTWVDPKTPRTPQLIVLHSTENPDCAGLAKAVANYFHGPNAPQASCHIMVDNRELYRCVHDRDIAWGAGGANKVGLHLEMGGFAAQSATQWSDDYSREVLYSAMGVCAAWALRFNIPPVFLDSAALLSTKDPSGITTHAEVTKAFKKSTHTDPGRGFPIDAFVNGVGWMLLRLMNPESKLPGDSL